MSLIKFSIYLLIIFFPQITIAQDKIALIIGVENYKFTASPLKTPFNDAIAMDSVLTVLGYDVDVLLDPSKNNFNEKLKEFKQKVKKAKSCIFYYSGYGIQYDGYNYISFTNSNPTKPENIPSETFALNELLYFLGKQKLDAGIIILDAARNNPLVNNWKINKYNIEIGLNSFATFNLPPLNNIEILMANVADKIVNEEFESKNSLFTQAIIYNITVPNLEISSFSTRVNSQVRKSSESTQIPLRMSTMSNDFYFIKK